MKREEQKMLRMVSNLQQFQQQVMDRLSRWKAQDFMGRLRAKDPALWSPASGGEIRNRLGWLTLPSRMRSRVKEFEAFSEEVRADGFSHIVLCGMGGSSLAPEIFQASFGNAVGYPELILADSTHPRAVESVGRNVELDQTLFVISSKSGTTIETRSLFYHFWKIIGLRRKDPGRQFVAITDQGTPLHTLGQERKFRRIFLAPSDVGGRFSAFSDFGLVPSALIGMDIDQLLEKAELMEERCTDGVMEERMFCLYLGAALGEMSAEKDKMTVLTSGSLSRFPHWLEQLVAESLGKEGKGIFPVIDEPRIRVNDYSSDRFFVSFLLEDDRDGDLSDHLKRIEMSGHPTIRIDLKNVYGLAQEIFRWEMAVAAAGSVLGVDPFNQPDVELSKKLALKAMQEGRGSGLEEVERDTFCAGEERTAAAFSSWISQAKLGHSFTVQAFLPPTPQVSKALQSLRRKMLKNTGLAGAVGFGPRFLHSTGQLHKGGPDTGLFLQLVDAPGLLLEVPETDFSFNALIQAQAWGDFLALKERNRRVFRIDLGRDPAAGIQWLEQID
jgi:transaldolase/glucose-6-phosphate isomerase